jgi:hypothetical protein
MTLSVLAFVAATSKHWYLSSLAEMLLLFDRLNSVAIVFMILGSFFSKDVIAAYPSCQQGLKKDRL